MPVNNPTPVRLGASNTGNTVGNTGISTGDWVFAGSNNITISESTIAGGPNTLWVSGPNVGGGAALTVQDSATTLAVTKIVFSNANNVSLGLNTAASIATLTASVAAQSVQSAIQALGASNTGNTAGNTGVSTGIDWVLAGSNNITISQSTVGGGPNTLWVSGPNVGGAQTGISGIVVSNTTYTSGTVSFSNQANVTIGSSTNGATQYIRLSVAAQSTQSAIKGLGVSNTGNTAGNTGLSTGIDWVVAGSNGITASQSTAGGGPNTIWISGVTTVAQSAQSAIKGLGVSNTGNTAGNTGLSTGIDWVVAGSNGITASQSTAGGGPNTIWISGTTYPAQSNQSAIKGLGVSNTGNTAGNTGLSTGIDWVVAGSNGITASQSTTAGGPNTIWISGTTYPAQSNQSAIRGFGASNTGNTAGNTGISTGIDWVLAGTANITVSESTTAGGPNTLWLSAPNVAAGAVTFSAGANSAGLGSVVFSNSNGVSFGLNGSTITASAAGGGGIAGGVSNTGNTAGNTKTFSTGTLVFAGSSPMTMSQSTDANGATIYAQAPAVSSLYGTSGLTATSNGISITIQPNLISEYWPDFVPGMNSTNNTLGQSSVYFMPFDVTWPIAGSRVNFFLSVGTSTNTQNSTGSGSQGFGYAIYSRGTGASTERLSQLTSYSLVWLSYSFSSNTQFNATYYNGLSNATSHSTGSTGLTTSNASTFLLNSLGGFRVLALPLNQTLTPGRYWMAVSNQSTTANQTNMSAQATVLQSTFGSLTAYMQFGTSSSAQNASYNMWIPGFGTYSAQTNAFPATIPLTTQAINFNATNQVAVQFNISGYSTNNSVI